MNITKNFREAFEEFMNKVNVPEEKRKSMRSLVEGFAKRAASFSAGISQHIKQAGVPKGYTEEQFRKLAKDYNAVQR